MGVIIVPRGDNSGSGGTADHSHTNLALLNSLKVDASGHFIVNNQIIGEQAIEVNYELTLTQSQVSNKCIELPFDCDAQRAITLTLASVPQIREIDWEVIEHEYPQPDLISWDSLQLEQIAQVGDKVNITYYKKI